MVGGRQCEMFGDECVRLLSKFSDEELRNLSVHLLNAILTTHCLTESVKLSSDLEISLGSLFSFMESLPILEIFFDVRLLSFITVANPSQSRMRCVNSYDYAFTNGSISLLF